jgi:hypothetical protein
LCPSNAVYLSYLIGIEIAIEIEKNYHTGTFDPDPDSDPEKRFEKHQTHRLMTLSVYPQMDSSLNWSA